MGACFCTGRCKEPPYHCAAGDFSSRYDPDYEENLKRQGVLEYLQQEAEKRRRRRADAARRAKNPGKWARPVVTPVEEERKRVAPLTTEAEDTIDEIVERIRRAEEDRSRPADWWDIAERASRRRRTPYLRSTSSAQMSARMSA